MTFFHKLYLHFFKRRFIKNYRTYCKKKIGHALLYYKTDSLIINALAEKYIHTNDWEVLAITKILNKLGYWVDIIDRDIHPNALRDIHDKYDIFIGIGAGNSGKYFPNIAEKLPKALKIFYAAGPEPDESNRLTLERYDYFKSRHPDTPVVIRRTIDKVDIRRAMRSTDAIFCIGNDFTLSSYRKHHKKIYRVNPSTSPAIHTSLTNLTRKNRDKFLYFGGNGNIVKGLDILIEAFSHLPELDLYICAPNEPDFDAIYAQTIKESPNIHFIGFIPVGGEKFDELTEMCGYVILPSCSEGLATSIITCMRKGLIPVTTEAAAIDLKDFGFEIKDIGISAIQTQLKELSRLPQAEFQRRIISTYFDSFDYTQENFSSIFEKNIIIALNSKI